MSDEKFAWERGSEQPAPKVEKLAEPNDLTLFQCKLDKSHCEHEWEHGDGRDDDRCIKCGQGFLAYVFMEMP